MKHSVAFYGLLVFSFFGLFACSKNNTDVSLRSPKYGPGDTMEVRGNINGNDETALLYSLEESENMPAFPAFLATGDGFDGVQGKKRSIMKFRIRHVDYDTRFTPPPVQKAVLYLYQYYLPTDQNPYRLQQDTNNAVALHRVAGDWQASTVSWSTQPSLASGAANPLEDVVIIPAVTTPLLPGNNDNQEIDITDMMRKIFETRDNKGLLLKLINENAEVGRSFGSFASPQISKRPKLIIYF